MYSTGVVFALRKGSMRARHAWATLDACPCRKCDLIINRSTFKMKWQGCGSSRDLVAPHRGRCKYCRRRMLCLHWLWPTVNGLLGRHVDLAGGMHNMSLCSIATSPQYTQRRMQVYHADDSESFLELNLEPDTAAGARVAELSLAFGSKR